MGFKRDTEYAYVVACSKDKPVQQRWKIATFEPAHKIPAHPGHAWPDTWISEDPGENRKFLDDYFNLRYVTGATFPLASPGTMSLIVNSTLNPKVDADMARRASRHLCLLAGQGVREDDPKVVRRFRATHLRVMDGNSRKHIPQMQRMTALDFLERHHPEEAGKAFDRLFRKNTKAELEETQAIFYTLAQYYRWCEQNGKRPGKPLGDPTGLPLNLEGPLEPVNNAMRLFALRLAELTYPALTEYRINIDGKSVNPQLFFSPEEIYRGFAPDYLKKKDRENIAATDIVWMYFDTGIVAEVYANRTNGSNYSRQKNLTANYNDIKNDRRFINIVRFSESASQTGFREFNELAYEVGHAMVEKGFLAHGGPQGITPAMIDEVVSVATRKSHYAHIVRTLDALKRKLAPENKAEEDDYKEIEFSSRTVGLVQSYPEYVDSLKSPSPSEQALRQVIMDTPELRQLGKYLPSIGIPIDTGNEMLNFDPLTTNYAAEDRYRMIAPDHRQAPGAPGDDNPQVVELGKQTAALMRESLKAGTALRSVG